MFLLNSSLSWTSKLKSFDDKWTEEILIYWLIISPTTNVRFSFIYYYFLKSVTVGTISIE